LFGAGELIWGFVIKNTPLGWYQCVNMKDDYEDSEDEDEDEGAIKKSQTSLTQGLKKSSTLRK
jgi:hypothetical protein